MPEAHTEKCFGWFGGGYRYVSMQLSIIFDIPTGVGKVMNSLTFCPREALVLRI